MIGKVDAMHAWKRERRPIMLNGRLWGDLIAEIPPVPWDRFFVNPPLDRGRMTVVGWDRGDAASLKDGGYLRYNTDYSGRTGRLRTIQLLHEFPQNEALCWIGAAAQDMQRNVRNENDWRGDPFMLADDLASAARDEFERQGMYWPWTYNACATKFDVSTLRPPRSERGLAAAVKTIALCSIGEGGFYVAEFL